MVDQGMRDGKGGKGFILSGIHIIIERCGGDVRGNGSKHVKGTTDHQLQKFTTLELVS